MDYNQFMAISHKFRNYGASKEELKAERKKKILSMM